MEEFTPQGSPGSTDISWINFGSGKTREEGHSRHVLRQYALEVTRVEVLYCNIPMTAVSLIRLSKVIPPVIGSLPLTDF
jgi:hypothetical protein